MNRPDYITCVRQTHESKNHLTWCGVEAHGFVFDSIDHAAYNALANGRLVICEGCKKKIIEALNT